MRNVSDQVVEKIKIQASLSKFIFFFSKIVSFMRKCGKNVVEPDRQIACWTTKARKMPSEFVIRIAFPVQQWLHERVSLLHLYPNCFSCFFFNVHGSMYRNNILVYKSQQDAHVTELIFV